MCSGSFHESFFSFFDHVSQKPKIRVDFDDNSEIVQSSLVILTVVILNNCLSRREKSDPCFNREI